MFCFNRSKLKNAKIILDLTTKRFSIFTNAIDCVKIYSSVDYVMIDVKCRLKAVVFKNDRSNSF